VKINSQLKSIKMKKITLCLMAAFLSLTFIPVQSQAGTVPTSTSAATPVESAEANSLKARLDEIKEMDKSNMSSSEKKSLRKEVRSIKSQLNELGGGVYLSVGAVIIILLLLILLL
jgi:hypothetical protein